MQRWPDNLSAEDRRVYRNVVGGLVAMYAAIFLIIAGMIVDNQITQATARNETASVAAKSTPAADGRTFRQAVKYD